LSVCSCLICCPPTPTLFPYTTLFRSRTAGLKVGRERLDCAAVQGRDPGDGEVCGQAPRELGAAVGGREVGLVDDDDRRGPAGREDRKSTRLNSSHVKISYAVFCLKKK